MADEPRSLAAALKITPEVQNFIQHGDNAKSPATKPEVEQSQVEAKPEPSKMKVVSKRSGGGQEEQAKIRRKQKLKPVIAPQLAPLSQARVAITTRFRQEVADSLRRASLERKLRGESPHSQQDIIENAVAAWLHGEGETPAKNLSTAE